MQTQTRMVYLTDVPDPPLLNGFSRTNRTPKAGTAWSRIRECEATLTLNANRKNQINFERRGEKINWFKEKSFYGKA